MTFVTAPLVAPATAVTHFGTATTHTNSLAGIPDFAATAPEIVETARALKGNPDTIFDFVHNQIQTEFAFGERKGPIGALIDKSGTPFDQNVLFVKLVRQAGYTARYQIGQVTIQSAAFAAWTGVSDLGAACRMLSSGGIPAVFSPSNPNTNCQASGAFTSVTLLHIWSQVQIGGTWYAYDPSFKTYAGPMPANLIADSGLTAGAATAAAATGVTSGVQGGANYIRGDVHADGQAQLAAYLTARGTQLLTWLKANAPALDTDQVTGVTKIQQAYAPAGGWRYTTPPGYTTGSAITISGDIPNQYRTQFQVSMTVAADGSDYVPALNKTFYVDDIDGRRIGIATNFNNTGGVNGGNINPAANPGFVPLNYTIGSDSLMVDDVAVQTWSCAIDFNGNTCRGAMSPGQITLTATHPYAAGTFADETVVKQLTATAAPVAIVSGWGMVSPARLARWSDEVANDTALPAWNTAPWPCIGQDVCFPTYAQSSGDLTRQKLAASWLAQISRMMTLQAVIGGAVAEHQHSMGVADWRYNVRFYQYPPPNGDSGGPEYIGISDEFTDLNIDTVASVTSKTNSAPSVAAISRSVALASATLEGSVLEQMEDLPDSASTASRFAWANDPGADNQTGDLEDPCFPTTNNPRRFFDFTGITTRGGLYTFEGSPAGCNAIPLQYISNPQQITTTTDTVIGQYLGAGFHVTGSAEVYLGPGARFGPCAGLASQGGVVCEPTQQRGDAIVATRFDAAGNVLQVAHVLTSINGISKGGGGKQPEHFAAYDPSKAGDALKDRFVDRSVALGVDLKSGTAGYSTPTLLSTGTGSTPYKLDYSLSYKAAPSGCNAFGPCTGAIQGGWNSNWDVRFGNAGSGLEAMGATSPFAAAGTLVAFLAMQDIYSQAGTSTLQPDVYAAMTADWWRQQMLANTATLNRGFSGAQYVRLVDGTWMPPVGSPGVLSQTGARVKVRDTCFSQGASYGVSTSRRWDITGLNFSLRNAGGDVMAFAPWSWEYDKINSDNCAIAQGYEPTTWTWPQGVSLTFTYGVPDPNGFSQTDTTGGVSAIASSLGRSLTLTGGFTGGINGATPKALTATTAGASGPITVGQTKAPNLATIADAAGAAWNFSYTAIQQRAAAQRPVPYQQLYQVFEPVSATLPALQYGYDTRGLVETAYDANGLQLAANASLPPYTWYLALGGLGERDDPMGGAYSVYYDTDGNEVRNIDEIGREVDSAWDGRHRVTSRTFPERDRETFGYDTKDNVVRLTKVPKPGSGLGNIIVRATYESSWNHLASITDPMTNETDFTYYPNAGLCGTTGATASLMCLAQRPAVNGSRPTYAYQYSAIGLPTQSVDPTGVTTLHVYDSYGNLTSTTEGAAAVGSNPALTLTTTFTPDSWGNVIATRDPLAHISNQTFDLDRRVLLAIAPDPGTGARPATKTTYDANGRPYQVDKGTTNASGATFTAVETTTTAFDPNGNKTQVSVLNGTAGSAPLSVTQMNHDGVNRVICTAGRENAAVFGSLPDACLQSAGGPYGPDPITRIAYDLAGQELSETRGLGTSLAGAYAIFTWGADGEKTSVADANGNTIHLGYDGFNRLNLITHPDNTTETSVYDPDGDQVIWTNRGGFGVVRCYDVLNRNISESGITGASLSGACATGGTTNLTTRSWDIQPRTFTYDPAGRLTAANIPNFGLSYSYDAAGRPTNLSNARTAGYGWDDAGNLQTLTYPDGTTVVTYQYDALNRTTKALIGGQSDGALSYDALGRRQTLTFRDGSTQTWGYDNADRVTSIAHVFPNDTGNNVTFTYGYDPVGREMSKTVDNAAYDYVPPAANVTYAAANALNQYPSVNSYPYSYWPEGGLKETDTLAANYDELGTMIEGFTTLTPGVIDPAYGEYVGVDALGHKYFHEAQTVAGQPYPFVYHSTDGLRPETILEWVYQGLNGAPQTLQGTRRYVLGPDPDERWAYIGPNGGTYNPHTDREGTLIALSNGGLVSRIYTWDAYGQNTSPADETSTGPAGYLYRYTGQRYDPATSLYDYKAREYSPVLGRFLQPDPAGLDQGPNLYEYVGGNPLGAGDPSGECPVIACGLMQNQGGDEFDIWGLGTSSDDDPLSPSDLAAGVTQPGTGTSPPVLQGSPGGAKIPGDTGKKDQPDQSGEIAETAGHVDDFVGALAKGKVAVGSTLFGVGLAAFEAEHESKQNIARGENPILARVKEYGTATLGSIGGASGGALVGGSSLATIPSWGPIMVVGGATAGGFVGVGYASALGYTLKTSIDTAARQTMAWYYDAMNSALKGTHPK